MSHLITKPSLPQQPFSLSSLLPFTTYECLVRGANIAEGHELWGAFSDTLDATTDIDGEDKRTYNILIPLNSIILT